MSFTLIKLPSNFWNSLVRARGLETPLYALELLKFHLSSYPSFHILHDLVFKNFQFYARGFKNDMIYPYELALQILNFSSLTSSFWNSVVYTRGIGNLFLFNPFFLYVASFYCLKFSFKFVEGLKFFHIPL